MRIVLFGSRDNQVYCFLGGESLNSGDFTAYVLVDFPMYKGPIFDSGKKTMFL